jgi:hypothetical protein
MRVTKAQVTKYKSVTDSGEFLVDDHMTALVGKNEAGKTAVLEALYRFNPLPSGHPTTFEPLRDYPRSSYNRDKAKISKVEPLKLTLVLEDADIAAVEAKFGKGSVIATQSRLLAGTAVTRRTGTPRSSARRRPSGTWWRRPDSTRPSTPRRPSARRSMLCGQKRSRRTRRVNWPLIWKNAIWTVRPGRSCFSGFRRSSILTSTACCRQRLDRAPAEHR